MQLNYRKEAYNHKQWKDEKVKPLDIRLTNILLTCGYPQDQMDTKKVEVIFNVQNILKTNTT